MNLLESCGTQFIKHDIDYESFIDLKDNELAEMELPIGPRKRLQREISRIQGENKSLHQTIKHRAPALIEGKRKKENNQKKNLKTLENSLTKISFTIII